MGEDRRQGDRRQNPEGDRRASASITNEKTKKEPITISLQVFIIAVVITLVIIAGVIWFVTSRITDHIDETYGGTSYLYDDDEYLDDEYSYEYDDTDEELTDEQVDASTTEETTQENNATTE